jgi:uroporphyrinogen III methyltransferase / synthase
MKRDEQAEDHRNDDRHKPLRDRTILITRARTQSADIISRLEALGATVIHCPTIEVVPPDSWASLDASIDRIRQYDWIVFTSANGVRFFFQRLTARHIESRRALSSCVICAIGPATARALDKAGSSAQVIASDSKSEGALKAIVNHLGAAAGVQGLRFLIPRARIARDVLPTELRKLGAQVDAVDAYQTVKPDLAREEIISLFKTKRIDAITFTSPSTVSNFAELVGLKDLSELLKSTLVACIGPITARTAARFGLRKTLQPRLHNAIALVEVIVESLGRD